jgi:hypothetical protein
MEKPIPPLIQDFDLTEQDLRLVPKPINQKITRTFQLQIGLSGGVFFGLFSLWGMFEKTDSLLYGAYFGLAIGFIVFLMVTFLGGVIVVLIANFISYLQMMYYGRFNEKTRRAYQYFSANKEYDIAMKLYERYRHKPY